MSQLYPYFEKEVGGIIQEIYEAGLIYIPPPPEIDLEDIGSINQFIYSAGLRSILVDYSFIDAQVTNQSIYSASFSLIVVNYAVADSMVVNQNIHSVDFSLIGIYVDFDTEVSGIQQSIYQAYFGVP